jgi:hypothetical protein
MRTGGPDFVKRISRNSAAAGYTHGDPGIYCPLGYAKSVSPEWASPRFRLLVRILSDAEHVLLLGIAGAAYSVLMTFGIRNTEISFDIKSEQLYISAVRETDKCRNGIVAIMRSTADMVW